MKIKKGSQHSGHTMPTATKRIIRARKITSKLTCVYHRAWNRHLYCSIAVLSDAFHTFSAVGGILLALAASRTTMTPADPFKTFGLKRAEVIGALLNGIFL